MTWNNPIKIQHMTLISSYIIQSMRHLDDYSWRHKHPFQWAFNSVWAWDMPKTWDNRFCFKINLIIFHLIYLLPSTNNSHPTIPVRIINFNCTACMFMACSKNFLWLGSGQLKFLLRREKTFIGTFLLRTVTKNYFLLIRYIICYENRHNMVILFAFCKLFVWLLVMAL